MGISSIATLSGVFATASTMTTGYLTGTTVNAGTETTSRQRYPDKLVILSDPDGTFHHNSSLRSTKLCVLAGKRPLPTQKVKPLMKLDGCVTAALLVALLLESATADTSTDAAASPQASLVDWATMLSTTPPMYTGKHN